MARYEHMFWGFMLPEVERKRWWEGLGNGKKEANR
jgi:hypothetical protein